MTPELNATIQTLLEWVLPPLAAALVAWGVRQALGAYAAWRASQPDKAFVLEQAAAMVVKAAEQNGLVAKAKGMAFDKKDWALFTLRNLLDTYGVRLDLNALSAAIEAAVLEQFPKSGGQDPA